LPPWLAWLGRCLTVVVGGLVGHLLQPAVRGYRCGPCCLEAISVSLCVVVDRHGRACWMGLAGQDVAGVEVVAPKREVLVHLGGALK
jgi:hypothetical protein